jgi:hypothetical protein
LSNKLAFTGCPSYSTNCGADKHREGGQNEAGYVDKYYTVIIRVFLTVTIWMCGGSGGGSFIVVVVVTFPSMSM